MGLFGSKKKPDPREESQQRASRSRRIVAPVKPGQASPGQAKPGQGKPAAGSDSQLDVARTPTSRVKHGQARPGSSPGVQTPKQQAKPVTQRTQAKPPDDDIVEINLGNDSLNAGPVSASQSQSGPSRTGDEALFQFLVEKAALLSPAQVQKAKAKAHEEGIPVDVACVKLGFFSEEQLVKSLTEECWVPHLKVEKYAIRKKALDAIEQADALRFGVLPVDKLGSILNLAMVNPLDTETIRVLEQKTGLDIKKVVATRSEIESAITRYYGGGADSAVEQPIAIEQDIPSQRVTQMLQQAQTAGSQERKVAVSPTPEFPAAVPATMLPAVAPVPASLEADDIIDIDDLLGAEDVVKPAVIEPISISVDDLGEDEGELFEATVTSAHRRPMSTVIEDDALEALPSASATSGANISLDSSEELPEFLEEQPLIRAATAQAPAPVVEAPEPTLPKPSPQAAKPASTPALTPIARPQPAAPSRPTASSRPAAAGPVKPAAPAGVNPPAAAPTKPVASARPPAAPAKPAAASSAAAAAPAKPRKKLVELVAVREEEFQHAITHGKARLFEKWQAIQTRNRILNAVALDESSALLLEPVFARRGTVVSAS